MYKVEYECPMGEDPSDMLTELPNQLLLHVRDFEPDVYDIKDLLLTQHARRGATLYQLEGVPNQRYYVWAPQERGIVRDSGGAFVWR